MKPGLQPRASRQQSTFASISALTNLLELVIATPNEYLNDAELNSALRSQGSLSKYKRQDTLIVPMSLNHQKAVAQEMLDGGYTTIDSLRRRALGALQKERIKGKAGNKQTKAGLLQKVAELEATIQVQDEDMWIIQRAYDMRCLQARNYAADGGAAVQALCQKEQREIDASLSLRRRPKPSTTVASFHGRHHDR